MQLASPVVVGGMGGSGTRVVVRILRRTGRYMGVNVNDPQEDALDFAGFDYRWAPRYLAALGAGAPLPHAEMAVEFEEALERFLRGRDDPAQPWGWKHSPSVHLLPFMDARFPGLRFIHVIRDGRDTAMGTSGGRTHTRRLGRAVLDGDPTPVTPETPMWRGRAAAADGGPEATPLRQIRFWRAVHTAAADYGESNMPRRYLRIRLEDLCSDPHTYVRQIIDFAGAAYPRETAVLEAAAEVVTPDTIGRWRHEAPGVLSDVHRLAGDSLRRFGYIP
jgi:Sulfotransferase family